MKAIILAAGKGKRISKEIGDIPKSTLKIKSGKCIIENTVDILEELGIQPVVCLGYKKEEIQRVLKGKKVDYCYNPFYSITNNIASLWFAQPSIGKAEPEDVLILSADIIWEKGLIQKLVSVPGDLLLAAVKADIHKGDYFFHTDSMGKILSYGPDLPESQRDYSNIGAVKISAVAWESFLARLNALIENEEYQKYYENVLLSFIRENPFWPSVVDVGNEPWYEIDFYEDYLKYL